MPGTPTPIQPTPQPPQPPQPTPHRQDLQPAQPRQPPHPWKPPHPRTAHPRQPPHLPHPRWASCTPLRAFSSSSKSWKVARLTSESSSSPSVIIMPGMKFWPFCTSPIGTAAAYALPAAEKVNPATLNAGTAALVTRFFFEACFTRGMVASSNMVQRRISVQRSYADQTGQARFMRARKCNGARSDCIHLDERDRHIFVQCSDGPWPSPRPLLGAVRNCPLA
jgi:hypothetical protein